MEMHSIKIWYNSEESIDTNESSVPVLGEGH